MPLDFIGTAGSELGSFIERALPFMGENCERVSHYELRKRLRKTLDFLHTNNRPNWQTIVAEHEEFLEFPWTRGTLTLKYKHSLHLAEIT